MDKHVHRHTRWICWQPIGLTGQAINSHHKHNILLAHDICIQTFLNGLPLFYNQSSSQFLLHSLILWWQLYMQGTNQFIRSSWTIRHKVKRSRGWNNQCTLSSRIASLPSHCHRVNTELALPLACYQPLESRPSILGGKTQMLYALLWAGRSAFYGETISCDFEKSLVLFSNNSG